VTEESDNTLNNEHIFEYLEYYCDIENSFDFGVMINGPWGVGKTFLIKSFLANLKDKKSITGIYISSYGKTLPKSNRRRYLPTIASDPWVKGCQDSKLGC
jgi:Ni2+-binding GTPase involved in maturation of urease and hydrogenase